MVRKANIDDADKIHYLLQPYIKQKILLPRSVHTIRSEIELTWVYEREQEICATLSLLPFEECLYELRAMVVSPYLQGQGIGRDLLVETEKFVVEHLSLPMRLFALTYSPSFFLKNGFQEVPKETFPQKIYDVCEFCTRYHECKEIAVEKIIVSHETS